MIDVFPFLFEIFFTACQLFVLDELLEFSASGDFSSSTSQSLIHYFAEGAQIPAAKDCDKTLKLKKRAAEKKVL